MEKLLKCCRAEVLLRRFVRSGKYRARCAKCNAEMTKADRPKLTTAWNRLIAKKIEAKRQITQDLEQKYSEAVNAD